MRTKVDRQGRIRIPKSIRDELGLRPGLQLDVSVGDGRIEIEVPLTPMRLEARGGVSVAVTDVPMPRLTQDIVRDTTERVRRSRW